MSAYGDETVIAQMLGPAQPSAGFTTELADRITAMNETVSALIEEKTGRVWLGSAPSPATRTVYPRGGWSTTLVLPVPATSISEVTVWGNDAGGVITGGSVLPGTSWAIALRNDLGEITAIRSTIGAVWIGYGVVQIEGVWSDSQETVPAEIEWVANYVTAERMKQEQANPAGFIGPDGTVAPIRDPWADTQVKAVLKRWRVTGKGLVL